MSTQITLQVVELAARRVADRMMHAHQFEGACLNLDLHKAIKDFADEIAKIGAEALNLTDK